MTDRFWTGARRQLILGLCLLPAPDGRSARADHVDCKAVANSDLPYELEVENAARQMSAIQSFRMGDLRRVQLVKKDGAVERSVFQANFQLESPGLSGPVRFEYDVPTNRYIWDGTQRTVKVTSIVGDHRSPPTLQTYHIIGDGTVTLSGCLFHVKHFTADLESRSIRQHLDVLFALELNAIVQYDNVTNFSNGRSTHTQLTAKDIKTSFDLLAPSP